ncbi:tetratricopeptide repeat protein [uncultured Methanobrevibacter sp.]|uniref:tetratricopeptide repeat protein n=1 Tax=uncultured Methanobrevibacter sp. TaxID=253161 RepID=UPI0025D879AF|nr:tetratricopeptide repeat protein [uncultured Methanobrevibacter sp.]
MPILSFGSQNINIITGSKRMTIRKIWKHPLKVGDRLYCYWNLVSKEKTKIFEAKVTDIDLINYGDLKSNDELAREEGYEDAKDMVREFKKMYLEPLKDSDVFQIIYFEKLDVDDWEGEKIDEKAMITQRADILFDSGKYDKSVLCYTAALKFDTDDVYLLNKKGDNLSRLGKFEESLECYDKALAIESDNEYIWNNKAIAYLNSGNPNQALKANDKAIKINPRNTVVLYWRGFILEVLGNLEEALQVYNIILNIDDTNPEVWNAIGDILTDLERPEDALLAYDKGLELCLEDSQISAVAQNRRGNALLELGRFNEALNCYDKAISIEKDNTSFLLNKGVVLMELGEFQQAENLFTKVLAIDPNNEDAKILKIECLENF